MAAAERMPSLLDVYRMGVHPRWEIANWRDYQRTRRSLGWLRDFPRPPHDAPRALFVLRREDIFDIKTNLMLGAALQLEGVRPVILANHRRVPRIRRFAAAFGIDTLLHRSEFPLDETTEEEIDGRIDDLMSRTPDFAAVKAWLHEGHALGERVLSTLIRETLDGEPELEDADVRRRLEAIVRQALVNYWQAERILDEVEPRWLMACETGYATNGPLVDVAIGRGLDVLEVSPFLRDGALIFKRVNSESGRAPASSVSTASLERLERRAWTSDQDAELDADLAARYAGTSSLHRMFQWRTENADRGEICGEFGIDPSLPIAVVFTHVLWDASFFYGNDLFLNYGEWLEQTVLRAVENSRVNWLIKTHPSNAFRLAHGDIRGPVAEVEVVKRVVSHLPQHVRLVLPETRISSLSLYRHADIGITVRGTPGLEMACFGKPVLTAGSGHYSGLGFTIDCDSAGEYLENLRGIESLIEPVAPEATVRARRYAHALFRIRPWISRSFELRLDYPDVGWHPLDRNVVPVAQSLHEAKRYGDLHRWAEWAINSRDPDYLEECPPAIGGTA